MFLCVFEKEKSCEQLKAFSGNFVYCRRFLSHGKSNEVDAMFACLSCSCWKMYVLFELNLMWLNLLMDDFINFKWDLGKCDWYPRNKPEKCKPKELLFQIISRWINITWNWRKFILLFSLSLIEFHKSFLILFEQFYLNS